MDSAAERQKPNLRPKPLLSGIPKLPTLVSIPIARSRLFPIICCIASTAFLQIVSSIAAGADPDVTGGAHYYLNPKSIGIFRRELRKKGPCHCTPQ
jgi:hypothetical protein